MMLQAVNAIQSQTLKPLELILIIDHNSDLYRRCEKQLKNIILAENQQSRGLSGSRNTGVSFARGELVAFIDEDALPNQDWLEQLASCYQDPGVIGAGGAIEPLWENKHPAWFPAEFDWVVGCTYLGMPQALSPVRNLIGCNMSFRQVVFERAGGFRNDMGRIGSVPTGCEETEFCIRVLQLWPDKKLVYQPKAIVKHRVPANRASWAYFRSRCYAEGLSKALVANYVGSKDGLSSERSYTLKTLPGGICKGLADGVSRNQPEGFRRSAAILAGLVITSIGYLIGSLTLQISGHKSLKPLVKPGKQAEAYDVRGRSASE